MINQTLKHTTDDNKKIDTDRERERDAINRDNYFNDMHW